MAETGSLIQQLHLPECSSQTGPGGVSDSRSHSRPGHFRFQDRVVRTPFCWGRWGKREAELSGEQQGSSPFLLWGLESFRVQDLPQLPLC